MQKSVRTTSPIQNSETDLSANAREKGPLRLGCCLIPEFTERELMLLRNAGITEYQVLAEFVGNRYVFPFPPSTLKKLQPCTISIHMPFWFHLLVQKREKYWSHFKSISSYWRDVQEGPVDVVAHFKNPKRNQLPRYKLFSTLNSNTKYYSNATNGVRIMMENDAGGKDKENLTLNDIQKVSDMIGDKVGFCLDTQHAYAAGQSIKTVDLNRVDMVHLNSIPPYVRYGGHLDRHSYTPLRMSKHGTDFVKWILEGIKPGTPIILERLSVPIILQDVKLIQEMNQ